MASIRANAEDEDSEEDADFDMKSEEDDEGEPSDESEAESGDAEMMDEQPKVSCIIDVPSWLSETWQNHYRMQTAGGCRDKGNMQI